MVKKPDESLDKLITLWPIFSVPRSLADHLTALSTAPRLRVTLPVWQISSRCHQRNQYNQGISILLIVGERGPYRLALDLETS